MIKFFTLLTVFLCSVVYAQTEPQAYNYPYKNADVASLTLSIMKSKYQGKGLLPKHIQSLSVPVIDGRNNTYLVEGRGDFRFYFYGQKKDAPLIFIIADLNGNMSSGYMSYEAELFYENGFNVVTISSAFFWNFVVSSSRTALPGVTDEDAQDMYLAMQKALEKVKSIHKSKITRIAAMGMGLGGLELAHISAIENKERKLGIERYLLVNPVVNILHMITQIETRVALALELGMPKVNYIKDRAFNFVVDTMSSQQDVTKPDFFLNLDKKFVLSEKEYTFLSGAVFRMSIGDTIMAGQLVHDRGVLKSKLSRWKRQDRIDEISELGFVGYMKKILVPEFSKKYPKLLDLLRHANFNFVRADVMNNQNIFLMHNADDFLVDADQIDYLKTLVAPERTKIYPLGGHLGNLWFEQNKNDRLKVFEDMK